MEGLTVFWITGVLIGILVVGGMTFEAIRVWKGRGRWRAALNLLLIPAAGAVAYGMLWNSTRYCCHVTCDFAGQWLMGRMFVRGEGHLLYTFDKQDKRRGPQWQALADGYHGEDPKENLGEMYGDIVDKNTWGGDTYEGPLYPPTAGLLFFPIALITKDGYPSLDPNAAPDPEIAHRRVVAAYVLLSFLSAALIAWGSRNRLRFGEAALLIFSFPNFSHAILLGQNPPLTLFFVVAGWALWARGYPVWGGIVWGLLAYKPVFAVALVWVPILLLSGRMLAGMVGSGALFCFLTLPFCLPPEQRVPLQWDPEAQTYRWTLNGGSLTDALEPWRRWYLVGQNAKRVYDEETNWTYMSRDLYSLPRRDMWYGQKFLDHLAYTFYFDTKQGVFAYGAPAPANHIQKDWVEMFPGNGPGLRSALGPFDRWRHAAELMKAARTGPAKEGDAEDETLPPVEPDNPRFIHVNLLGYALMGVVFCFTLFVALTDYLRRLVARVPVGYDAIGCRIGFLFIGAMFTTFHFIHYDLLMFALPVAMILAGRHSIAGWIWLAFWCLLFAFMSLDLGMFHQSMRMPVETIWLLVLWVYAGFASLWEPLRKPAADATAPANGVRMA